MSEQRVGSNHSAPLSQLTNEKDKFRFYLLKRKENLKPDVRFLRRTLKMGCFGVKLFLTPTR